MGRIVTSVVVENVPAARAVRIDALVDTGAGYLTLPLAWKERFGAFALEEEVALQTATQQVVKGTVCGPALIRVEGFRPVHGEILFIEMEPEEGEYEPLLGYIPLEQCGAAVDLIGHRLLPARYIDAKAAVASACHLPNAHPARHAPVRFLRAGAGPRSADRRTRAHPAPRP